MLPEEGLQRRAWPLPAMRCSGKKQNVSKEGKFNSLRCKHIYTGILMGIRNLHFENRLSLRDSTIPPPGQDPESCCSSCQRSKGATSTLDASTPPP